MSAGVANLPAEAVVIVSPAAARVYLFGLTLAEAQLRRDGAPLGRERFEALAAPLRNLAEPRPEPAEPPMTRGDDGTRAPSGSAPTVFLSVRDGAQRLGVSETYVRRLARTRLADAGLARKTDDGWTIAQEGIEMLENERARRAA